MTRTCTHVLGRTATAATAAAIVARREGAADVSKHDDAIVIFKLSGFSADATRGYIGNLLQWICDSEDRQLEILGILDPGGFLW